MKDIKQIIQEYRSVYVVADENVKDYAGRLVPGKPLYTIKATENNKNLQTVESICRWLLEQGADRDALLLAVGGGVTTDIAGFAASIYKRGIRYANVPTTLLSQVDAAIGGKTGVNLDSYKNIIGVIRQPEFTYVSAEPLATLPEKEFKSGAAEMLKTFIIGDEKLYERAIKLLKSKTAGREQQKNREEPISQQGRENQKNANRQKELEEHRELEFLISAAGAIKRRIVKADPYERGLRRVLNLGHTYAHAVEWYEHTHSASTAGQATAGQTATKKAAAKPIHTSTDPTNNNPTNNNPANSNPAGTTTESPLTHGEAVAVGIIRAAEISEAQGWCKHGLAKKLAKDFEACGLPTRLPCRPDLLSEAIAKDKKAEADAINFVLIKDIGTVIVRKLTLSQL